MTKIRSFTKHLLDWFPIHGRHDLPWQKNPTPYRVWVSEIMLQQTQVNTVIPYYQKFMERFSSITLLSGAEQDEVLHYWSGLGYYARARHLHRCAQIIVKEYAGQFPEDIDTLCALPGIGRSTAGAILSFSLNVRAPILDGNVKRVLTRYHAIGGAPDLWELAEQHTPTENFAQYTQAIMDLGATICTRRQPACFQCPVNSECQAYLQSRTEEFPAPKKSKGARPQKAIHLLILKTKDNHIFLEKRPPAGIWGGLWSFPECAVGENLPEWCTHRNFDLLTTQQWPIFHHSFTHFELIAHPLLLTVKPRSSSKVMEDASKIWYKLTEALPGGVAAPVSKLLKQLRGEM